MTLWIRRARLGRIGLLVVLAGLFPAEGRAQIDVPRFLSEHADFSSKDLQKLSDGQVVVKVPKPPDNREVQVLGVAIVSVPLDFFVERMRDVNTLGSSSTVKQIGLFSSPPKPEDLAGLEIPKDDVDALRKCEVGKCDMKLPGGAIERLQAEVDWSKSDYSRRVHEFVAQGLAVYLQNYMAEGDAALATYDDKSEPLSVAEGFRQLLGQSRYLVEYDSEFHSYLSRYPKASLSGVEDIFYWSVEDFSLKPTIELNHMVIRMGSGAGGAGGAGGEATIATKQLYASHYFQAALDFVTLVELPGREAVYVMWYLRQRFDGKVSGIKRSLLESGLRGNIGDVVGSLRTEIETAYKANR